MTSYRSRHRYHYRRAIPRRHSRRRQRRLARTCRADLASPILSIPAGRAALPDNALRSRSSVARTRPTRRDDPATSDQSVAPAHEPAVESRRRDLRSVRPTAGRTVPVRASSYAATSPPQPSRRPPWRAPPQQCTPSTRPPMETRSPGHPTPPKATRHAPAEP